MRSALPPGIELEALLPSPEGVLLRLQHTQPAEAPVTVDLASLFDPHFLAVEAVQERTLSQQLPTAPRWAWGRQQPTNCTVTGTRVCMEPGRSRTLLLLDHRDVGRAILV